MNGVYMRSTPDEELTSLIMPFLLGAGLPAQRGQVLRMIPYIRERMTATLKDAIPLLEFLFAEPRTFDPVRAAELRVTPEDAQRTLATARDALTPLAAFEPREVEAALQSMPERAGVAKKAAFMAVRVAITGKTATPPLFECIAVLGKPRALDRLGRSIDALGG
jgi:glutamyl-tRNA synthetase